MMKRKLMGSLRFPTRTASESKGLGLRGSGYLRFRVWRLGVQGLKFNFGGFRVSGLGHQGSPPKSQANSGHPESGKT